MYQFKFKKRAEVRIEKIAKGNPEIAEDIAKKIKWLAENADDIVHEQLRGYREKSLHCGQYRILYSLDRTKEIIIIEDIDKHDRAYRRVRRR